MSTGTLARPLIDSIAFTHGTMEVRDAPASMKFYKEFLGLRSIRMNKQALYVWLGGDWLIAALIMGDHKKPQSIDNRFVLRVSTKAEVDTAHAAALAQRDKWNIKDVRPIVEKDGDRSFCLYDLDENWWEISSRPAERDDALFARKPG